MKRIQNFFTENLDSFIFVGYSILISCCICYLLCLPVADWNILTWNLLDWTFFLQIFSSTLLCVNTFRIMLKNKREHKQIMDNHMKKMVSAEKIIEHRKINLEKLK